MCSVGIDDPMSADPPSDSNSHNDYKLGQFGESAENDSAAKCAAIPPDLSLVVAAWPELPKAVKAGILAMVQAAKGANE